MNIEARQHLDALLARNPDTLVEEEIAFIKARESYLTEVEKMGLPFLSQNAEETPAEPTEPKKAKKSKE